MALFRLLTLVECSEMLFTSWLGIFPQLGLIAYIEIDHQSIIISIEEF